MEVGGLDQSCSGSIAAVIVVWLPVLHMWFRVLLSYIV